MSILIQIIAALLLFTLAAVIQGLWLDRLMKRAGGTVKTLNTLLPRAGRAVFMALNALAVLLPHMIAILIWTVFYIFGAGAGEDVPFETALYFSASAHTGTAFGDVTMTDDWRVLAALQALGGLTLLVWSAAYLFEIFNRLYRTPANPKERTP